jgi:ABC-type uncharacterized transport system substrate-binding protein
MMTRRAFFTGLGAVLAAPFAANAQAGKIALIGYLQLGSAAGPPTALLQGLRELGYVEGHNIVIEYRYAEGRAERLPELAAQLVDLNVDIIVAGGTPAPLAAKQATSVIPIVMTSAGDPVGSGLVATLSRPGGNVTGLSLFSPEITGKRLSLIKDIVPGISRVAVLWNATNPIAALNMRETEAAARTLRLQVQALQVHGPDDIESALPGAISGRAGALFLLDDPLLFQYRQRIADFAAANRLPASAYFKEFAQAGGLMTFGPDLAESNRRAATFVDKILKGAKPGDLPVEQPTKFELVINLKTAKALGLTIPQSLLLRADQVIE